MKFKIIIIILILIAVVGWDGCATLENYRGDLGGSRTMINARGFGVVFLPDEIRLNKDFRVGLEITNYGAPDLVVEVELNDNWDKEYGEVHGSDSVFVSGFRSIYADELSLKNKAIVSFGPFKYIDDSVKGNDAWFDISLAVNNYEVNANADLPIVAKPGIQKFSLTNLGIENSKAPVAISKIDVSQEYIEENDDFDLELIITLKKYSGSIKEDILSKKEKIKEFSANLVGGPNFRCSSDESDEEYLLLNKDGETKISCITKIKLGDDISRDYPLEISFSYPYKIVEYSRKIKII